MKTVFFAGWKEYNWQPDPSMSRERMAKLMKAWRRSRTQGYRNFSLEKIGTHGYRVEAIGYKNEWHYVSWSKIPA
jgi:hypothetical protein